MHTARRPPCRFFIAGTCTKGSKCVYSHSSTEELLKPSGVDEGVLDARSSSKANSIGLPRTRIDSFCSVKETYSLRRLSSQWAFLLSWLNGRPVTFRYMARAVLGIDPASRLHQTRHVTQLVGQLGVTCFEWNFPTFLGGTEETEAGEALILRTFRSLALLFDDRIGTIVTLGLALQQDILLLESNPVGLANWLASQGLVAL
jgi:hypothetical protein